MLLGKHYSVRVQRVGRLELDLPMRVELSSDTWAILTQEDTDLLALEVSRRVRREQLSVVRESGWSRQANDGTQVPLPGIEIRDDASPEGVLVPDLLAAISFLTDAVLNHASRVHLDRYVAENAEDERLLAEFGTDTPVSRSTVSVATRTFKMSVTPEAIAAVLERQVGVRLYADAVRSGFDPARFRDFWRLLESAFNAQGDQLVDLLADYPPAQEMGFDRDELEQLLVLRGRASHAATRPEASLRELVDVSSSCARALPRLHNLAERVILTKQSWGHPTSGVAEIVPLTAFVGRGNNVTYRTTR